MEKIFNDMNNSFKVDRDHPASKRAFFNTIKNLLKEHGKVIFSWKTVEEQERSLKKNSTIYACYKLIADELLGGDNILAKCECKLNLGVDIILSDNLPKHKKFVEKYLELIEPLPYDTKLFIIDEYPLTSLMYEDQAWTYIRKVIDFYSGHGVDFGIITDKYGIQSEQYMANINQSSNI